VRYTPGVRTWRALIIIVFASTAFSAAPVRAFADDMARRLGGIKGDEATYVGMAASLAYDGDLAFDGRDYARFRVWYGSGPEGIFLKQDARGHLRFGKAFVYGALAAPFVTAFGLTGLVVFNVTCLVLVAASGAWWLSTGGRLLPALAFAVLFLLASVTPVYGAWLTSDLLNFTLVFVALVLGVSRQGAVPSVRLAVAMLLLALATFSKPIVLPLVGPLVLANTGWQPRRIALLGLVYGALVGALFGLNTAVAGEANYQGGFRKSFYGRFPFDEQGGTFETTGIDVATDTVLTPVGDEGRLATLLPNIGYFVAGRHFGLIPFGWPWLVALGLWTFAERNKRPWQWVLVASLALIALATLLWMPYTWSGAGGPIGNRYFLSVAGATFVLVPAVRSWWPPALAALGLVFMMPAYRDPVLAATQPWLATRSPVFDLLPLELTGASDFPIILDQRRGRIPQGRDPQLSVALLDEHAQPGRGGWIAVEGGHQASLLLRAPAALSASTVGVRTEAGCRVQLSSDAASMAVPLGDHDRQDVDLPVVQVFSHNSYVGIIRIDASACQSGVEIALQGRVAS
jgi:hypothetical protein